MKRRLLNLLTALSLLLCAVVIVVWARSESTFEDVRYVSAGPFRWTAWGVSSVDGPVFFGHVTHTMPPGNSGVVGGWRFESSTGKSRLWSWGMAYLMQMGRFGHHRLGFGVMHQEGIPVREDIEAVWALMVPHWFLACLCAVLPALWAREAVLRRRAARRGEHHLCTRCGYDLRATPERCPECGRAATGGVG